MLLVFEHRFFVHPFVFSNETYSFSIKLFFFAALSVCVFVFSEDISLHRWTRRHIWSCFLKNHKKTSIIFVFKCIHNINILTIILIYRSMRIVIYCFCSTAIRFILGFLFSSLTVKPPVKECHLLFNQATVILRFMVLLTLSLIHN